VWITLLFFGFKWDKMVSKWDEVVNDTNPRIYANDTNKIKIFVAFVHY